MRINVKQLTKMQIRKLTALRKSLGNEIADNAFVQWLKSQPSGTSGDPTKEQVRKLLEKDVLSGKLKIGRAGLIVRRGRGRLLVEDVVKPARRQTAKAARKASKAQAAS